MNQETFETNVETTLKLAKKQTETGKTRNEIIAEAVDVFLRSMGF